MEFREIRKHLKKNTPELIKLSIDEQRHLCHDREIPLLTRPGWIPPGPLDLDAARLELVEQVDPTPLAKALQEVGQYWPVRHDGGQIATYSDAVQAFDRPTFFFNGISYRLLSVKPSVDSFELAVTKGQYFDLLDTSEPLGYETAMLHRERNPFPIEGRYRRWLGDPFDFGLRTAIPGINTLTIRRTPGGAYFYMHERINVGTADQTVHVIPAGEFQPFAEHSFRVDLSIWHTIMREYAEEFCGVAWAVGDQMTVDYDNTPPCSVLSRRRGHGLNVFFLGVGLYPLTWKPEILTLCVFDDDVLDEAFPAMIEQNEEGRLILGSERASGQYCGLRFVESEVMRYAESDATLPAARACLLLAWRWRRQLGIHV